MKYVVFLAFFTASTALGQTPPEWFSAAFKANGLDKHYSLEAFIKPSFLLADFNGDHQQDIAITVTQKNTRKKGLLIVHGGSKKYFVIGAGTEFGSGGTDYKGMDKWSLYRQPSAQETQFDKASGDILGSKKISLKRPGILIADYEDGGLLAGGIIYWNGSKYIWIHQGE